MAEDATARRIFDKPVGVINQGEGVASIRDKDFCYENYEDWFVRQIILKRVDSEVDVELRWKAALAESGAKAIKECDEFLLDRFTGVFGSRIAATN